MEFYPVEIAMLFSVGAAPVQEGMRDSISRVGSRDLVSLSMNLRQWMRPLLFGIAAILLNYALYFAFQYLGILEYRIIRFSLDGIGIAVLVRILDAARQRRARERAEQLGFLNHHVRNAVQVMLNIHMVRDEAERNQAIHESVSRIINTLNQLTEGSFQLEELKDSTEDQTRAARRPLGLQDGKPDYDAGPDSKTV